MTIKCGIVGLPNVGKSTLFNALTAAEIRVENYPFCTIDPNVGVVPVPDPRLDVLTGIVHPQKTIPTTMEFVDIAGLVEGASKGEGLGNKFLGNIRETHALAHVVRCFENDDVTHVAGAIDPVDDIETINTELALADLESVEKQLGKAEKSAKTAEKDAIVYRDLLLCVRDHLDQGQPMRVMDLDWTEWEKIRNLHLITAKPVMYVANVDESRHGNGELLQCPEELESLGRDNVLVIAAGIEAEIATLATAAEQGEFLQAMGLQERGIDRLIRTAYSLLGLITFYTFAHRKLQAWQLPHSTTAAQAAGRIHTDMETGFIRAEVATARDLVDAGSWARLRSQGQLRTEGRTYPVEDGDIMQVLFKA